MNKIYSILFLSIFILNPLYAQSTSEVKDAQSISEVESIDCNAIYGYPAGNARCEREKEDKIIQLDQQATLAYERQLITGWNDAYKRKYFLPDDSYIALKCSRDRYNLTPAIDWMGDSNMFENGGYWIKNLDALGNYVNEYSNNKYIVLSPSNKEGWVIAHYINAKKKSTNVWEFGAKNYTANGPYEVTKFEITDYAYAVGFRDSLELSFSREDLSFGIPGWMDRAGSCEIISEAEIFFYEIDSEELRRDDYKQHNQKIADAKKSKRKF